MRQIAEAAQFTPGLWLLNRVAEHLARRRRRAAVRGARRPTTTSPPTPGSSICSRPARRRRGDRADDRATSSATTRIVAAPAGGLVTAYHALARSAGRCCVSLVPVICPPEAGHLADAIVDHLALTLGALAARSCSTGFGRGPRHLRPRRAAVPPPPRAQAHRRARRALLRVVGARPDADARAVRARDQPADVAVLLRAAADDGGGRLPAGRLDRRGHAASGSTCLRGRREEAGRRRCSRRIRCARASMSAGEGSVSDGRRASRPA